MRQLSFHKPSAISRVISPAALAALACSGTLILLIAARLAQLM
ncbi:MAG TPA: hypothetical protein VLT91_08615 [Rhizomicrobium sp.]|nr:hypothetical protein [Rhizomicrobium sp.]